MFYIFLYFLFSLKCSFLLFFMVNFIYATIERVKIFQILHIVNFQYVVLYFRHFFFYILLQNVWLKMAHICCVVGYSLIFFCFYVILIYHEKGNYLMFSIYSRFLYVAPKKQKNASHIRQQTYKRTHLLDHMTFTCDNNKTNTKMTMTTCC